MGKDHDVYRRNFRRLFSLVQISHVELEYERPASIVLFASTPSRLVAEGKTTLAQLQLETGAATYLDLVEACQSAEIPEADARLGFVADSLEETCHKLAIAINWMEKKPDAAGGAAQ